MAEDENKEIYLAGVLIGTIPLQAESQFAILLKTKETGQLDFSKLYYENSVDFNSFIGIFPTSAGLLTWGFCEDAHNTLADGRRLYWTILDKSDGAMKNEQAICFTPFNQSASSYNISPNLFKAFKASKSYSIAGLLAENTADKRAVVQLCFDDNPNMKQSWVLLQIPGVTVSNVGGFNPIDNNTKMPTKIFWLHTFDNSVKIGQLFRIF